MKPIKILVDSCADLPEDLRKQYEIDFIEFSVYFEGKEVKCSRDHRHFSVEKIYDALRDGHRAYTLPATEQEIRTIFKKFLRQGYDILYIASCEKQSSTIEKARRIATEFVGEGNDNRIEIIDSLNAGAAIGILAVHAARVKSHGMTLDEIKDEILRVRKNVLQYATVETLTYLSKANKVNARSAALGNLFNIKPILISDAEGNQVSISNIKGREASVKEIVRLFMENVENAEAQNIVITHGDDEAAAQYVREELERNNFKCKNIYTVCVGPMVGITAGPGMVAIYGFGKEVTYKGK